MAEKKCKHCAMMIPKEASTCPHCRKSQGWGCVTTFIAIVGVVIIFIIFLASQSKDGSNKRSSETTNPLAKDKSSQIASWIESKVNTGGYNGCDCKSLSANLVKCTLSFPAGTNTLSVEANVKGTADLFAQVGRIASTIYYIGYSGSQKVCEYKYDMYDATVTKTK